MSCNTLDKRTRKPHSFVASNPREHQKPTTKRETRKQLRRPPVPLHHRSHEPMSRPFTGLSRQSSFHVLPTTCRPIPPNFDRFQRLKCHFLQRSSGRLPRFGRSRRDSAQGRCGRPKCLQRGFRWPNCSLNFDGVSHLRKKAQEMPQTRPAMSEVEEVRFGARSLESITENVVIARKSPGEIVMGSFRGEGRGTPEIDYACPLDCGSPIAGARID